MAAITSVHIVDGEPERAVVKANGIVVDIIANDDGSVYVEAYAYSSLTPGGRQQAVVEAANIDAYQHRHPNIRLALSGPSAEA